jgi:hypothetical protein
MIPRRRPCPPRAAQPRPDRGGRARGHRLHDSAGNLGTGPAHGRPRRRGTDRPRHDRLPSAQSRSPSSTGRRPAGVRDDPRLPPRNSSFRRVEDQASAGQTLISPRCPAYPVGCPRANSMPAPEQVGPEPASRSRPQQAAAWSVAALITLARGNQRLAQQDFRWSHRFRYVGARDGEALAAPPRSATSARSRPGSCASDDDRSCCPGRSESPAHQGGSPSARHSWRNHRWCAASCAPSMWPPPVAIGSCSVTRSASAVTRARPPDRPHPARTPRCVGPASLRSGPPT